MKWREQKDRFLFIGERVLNVVVTLSYIFCVFGVVYIFGSAALGALGGNGGLDTPHMIICVVLVGLFFVLRWLSKYLEKKHYELKEIVFGVDLLKGDLYRIQQNQKDPNYIPIPVKRGSLEPEKELSELIGLEVVKDKVGKLNALYVYEKDLKKNEKKISQNINRHYAFIGNPGTGKTTVARIFAGLLYKSKRIKRNIYVECTGNDLISEFAGDTKNRIAKIYTKARNGVLFIDEAYVLAQSEERAAEALAQLLTYMENDPMTVVIFAGYKKEMEMFIAMNSGLASRISQKIYFPDYNAVQLLQIFAKFVQSRNMILSDRASSLMLNVFAEKIKQSEFTPFSNGRYARNCFDAVYQQHAVNLKNQENEEDKSTITEFDIKPILPELLAMD